MYCNLRIVAGSLQGVDDAGLILPTTEKFKNFVSLKSGTYTP